MITAHKTQTFPFIMVVMLRLSSNTLITRLMENKGPADKPVSCTRWGKLVKAAAEHPCLNFSENPPPRILCKQGYFFHIICIDKGMFFSHYLPRQWYVFYIFGAVKTILFSHIWPGQGFIFSHIWRGQG